MHRRALLAAAVTLASAGCLSSLRSEAPQLAWIRIRNERPERHDVDVTVENGDELVFSDSYQLQPADDEPTTLRLTPVEDAGEYFVTATVDGEPRRVDTTAVDEGGGCVGVRFTLRDDGGVDAEGDVVDEC